MGGWGDYPLTLPCMAQRSPFKGLKDHPILVWKRTVEEIIHGDPNLGAPFSGKTDKPMGKICI